MRFLMLNGKSRFMSVEKSRIDWKKKSLSKFQKEVKDFLFPYWHKHIVYEEMRVVGTRLRLDFYNANKKIAIECDGAQHSKFNEFFHQGTRLNYWKQICRDDEKDKWCDLNQIVLVRIIPSDLPLTEDLFKRFGVTL